MKRSDMALNKYKEAFPNGWLKLVVQLHAMTDEQRLGSVILLRDQDPDAVLKVVKRSELIDSMPMAFKLQIGSKPECCFLGLIEGLPKENTVSKIRVWCALKVDRAKHKRAVDIVRSMAALQL
jgi:hypothetical protein